MATLASIKHEECEHSLKAGSCFMVESTRHAKCPKPSVNRNRSMHLSRFSWVINWTFLFLFVSINRDRKCLNDSFACRHKWRLSRGESQHVICERWTQSSPQYLLLLWNVESWVFQFWGAWNVNQPLQKELSTSLKQNRCLSQSEVCRELTQDFCLCFEGVIAWGQSDDCWRGGFNDCGSNRREMKWDRL